MDDAQVRERITRWIEESKALFAVLPGLLELEHRLGAKNDQAEKETERLRKELDELRKQNEQLRAEKEEAGQALAKVLETVQATNQIAQKLGVTKSPFARRVEAPAPTPNPPATPTPTTS
jgi:septal ring factor EnvC (AmiA/AmiB activator)